MAFTRGKAKVSLRATPGLLSMKSSGHHQTPCPTGMALCSTITQTQRWKPRRQFKGVWSWQSKYDFSYSTIYQEATGVYNGGRIGVYYIKVTHLSRRIIVVSWNLSIYNRALEHKSIGQSLARNM